MIKNSSTVLFYPSVDGDAGISSAFLIPVYIVIVLDIYVIYK